MHNVVCEPISEKTAYANLQNIGANDRDSARLSGLYHKRKHRKHHHHGHNVNDHHFHHHHRNFGTDHVRADLNSQPDRDQYENFDQLSQMVENPSQFDSTGDNQGEPVIISKREHRKGGYRGSSHRGNLLNRYDIVFSKTNRDTGRA